MSKQGTGPRSLKLLSTPVIHVSLTLSWGREHREGWGFFAEPLYVYQLSEDRFHRCGSRSSGRERLIQGHTGAEGRIGPRTWLGAPSFKPLKSQPGAGARLAPSSTAPPLLGPGPRPYPRQKFRTSSGYPT